MDFEKIHLTDCHNNCPADAVVLFAEQLRQQIWTKKGNLKKKINWQKVNKMEQELVGYLCEFDVGEVEIKNNVINCSSCEDKYQQIDQVRKLFLDVQELIQQSPSRFYSRRQFLKRKPAFALQRGGKEARQKKP